MEKTTTIIPLLFTSCLCQFVMNLGMKPDVTFGDQNERFDVASIIQDQNRMDVANPTDDFRRLEHVIKDTKHETGNANDELSKGEQLLDALKETVGKDIKDFAYHSKMESSPDDDDYEKNLRVFGNRRGLQKVVDLHRRGMPLDPESEILFQHGVPVNMKIEGFLEVPLEKR